MMEDSTKAAGDTVESTELDKHGMSESSGSHRQHASTSSLKRHLRMTYGRRPMELVNRLFKAMFDLAAYVNNAAFLMRCRTLRIIPKTYRVGCREIKNTRHVVSILNDCSYRLMLADIDYNRLRKLQVKRHLEHLHEKLKTMISAEDLTSVVVLSKGRYENAFEATREEQSNMFAELLKEYQIDHREDEDNDE